MSFSSELKEELLHIEIENPCCLLAECYGLLLFGHTFSKSEMSIYTESQSIAQKYAEILKKVCTEPPESSMNAAHKYKVSVSKREDRLRVLSAFGYAGTERVLRLNWANISNDCCIGAFLRGAFLACGTITSPEKGYHLEFVVPHYRLSQDFKKFLEDNDFTPKEIQRNGQNVLYFKKNEEIQNLLAIMGATKFVMELIDVIVYKDIRNNVNRRLNFESANLNKTLNAAMQQIELLQTLQTSIRYQELSDELKQIMLLRIENPEFSLKQIGEEMTPPLSRSAVNHRIKKLCKIAEEIKQ